MGSVNKVILVGRLGADVELKYTPSNRPVCNLSIATSEQWKDKATGEKKEKTEWHRCQVWGELAEVCAKFLSKGRQVYVEGKLQTREYEKDGQRRFSTEIVVSNVVFLGSGEGKGQGAGQHREENAGSGKRSGWSDTDNSGPPPADDDVPF